MSGGAAGNPRALWLGRHLVIGSVVVEVAWGELTGALMGLFAQVVWGGGSGALAFAISMVGGLLIFGPAFGYLNRRTLLERGVRP